MEGGSRHPPYLKGVRLAESMAVYGLQHKRARLAGKAAQNQRSITCGLRKISDHSERIRVLEADTASIQEEISRIDNALLRAFNVLPTTVAQSQTPRLVKGQWGGIVKGCQEILRQSTSPLDTNTIALLLAAKLKVDISEHSRWKAFRNSVRCTLRRQADKGFIRRIHDPSHSELGRWALVRIPGK